MSCSRASLHTRSFPVRSWLILSAGMLLPAWTAAADDGGAHGLLDFDREGSGACLAGRLERLAEVEGAAFDEATGRNLRNFPRDRVVDHLHMKLEMRFDDPNDQRFTAVETLRVKPIGRPTTSLTLDAVGLDISGVRVGARTVEYFQDDEHVTLRFDPPLGLDAEHEIVFDYACDHPYAGMYFTPTSSAMPGYTAEVHTQGQTITNRHWFVAHDAPNERLTTELIVDVPAGYQVSSNGRLVSNFANDDRAVWHWLQDDPHAAYLVSLVIGRFDVVEIPHERVPMKVWVPPGLGPLVPQTYGRTGEMIDVFERRFGVPYPWDRYDQLVVKNFGAGGMENTSATTMYPTAILDETALLDADLEGLIAHELAHQWTGDLVTCKSWTHIWLNEGFATYGAALWFEYRDGEDGYLDSIRRSMRVAQRDRTTDAVGMVSPVWEHPRETFRRRANPYPKGSSILHMLRKMLGEEVFWQGIHRYMQRHALGTVETHDLREAMEEVSGRGLEWFFDQWCVRPGAPNLDVTVAFDGERRELLVDVEQTQHIDERTPAFRFTLPIHVRTPDGTEVFTLDVDARTASFRAVLDGMPDLIAIDPAMHVLATWNVTKPVRLWMAQATDGPTIVARHRAIEAIARTETPDQRALLARVATDASVHRTLRNAAIAGLRGYGSEAARASLRGLIEDGVADARVRVKAVEALADFEPAAVSHLLGVIAGSDPSYRTRVAAIETIASHEAAEHADLLVELVGFESQHDEVRRAALAALAALDDARGLDLAIRYSTYGYMDRARPGAIDAVGALAEHDRDRAVETLIGLLHDPCRRPARSAGAALAELGDERGLKPLEAIAETHPDPRRREAAARWVETLREKLEQDG